MNRVRGLREGIGERLDRVKEFWSRRDTGERVIIAGVCILIILLLLFSWYAVLDMLCGMRCVEKGFPRHEFFLTAGCHCCKRVNNTDIVIRLEEINDGTE